jgi:signal transduction histidine kinase
MAERLLIFISLTFILSQGYSQILSDSLYNQIKDLPDSAKVDKLNSFSWELRRDNIGDAIIIGRYSLNLARQIGYAKGEAQILNFIGVFYRKIDDFRTASDYFFKVLNYSDSLNLKVEKGYALNNIGQVLQLQDDNQQALIYLHKSLKLQTNNKHKEGIAYAHLRLSETYYNLKQYDSVLYHATIASKLFAELNYKEHTLLALERAGRAYEGLNQIEKAIDIYHYVINSGELSDPSILKAYQDLTQAYISYNKPDSAVYYAKKGLKIKETDLDLLANIILAYKMLDIKDSTILYATKTLGIQKKLALEERFRYTKYLQIAYETQEKQDENIELKYQLQITKLIIASSIITIILTLALLRIIYDRRKREKQLNISLQSKNVELNKLNASKDKFFSILAHDLKNPFNALLGLSDLLHSEIDDLDEEQIKDFAKRINDLTNQTYGLLVNLLEWSRIQLGTLEPSIEKINLFELLEESDTLLRPMAEQKGINFTLRNNVDCCLYADKEMLKTILRNLLTNALKFSNANDKVIIETEDQEENILFSVTDTGVGIAPDQKGNLFTLERSISTEGTAQEKGTGLGLILCKEFIDMHGGKIWVESEVNRGSIFRFTIPKQKLSN